MRTGSSVSVVTIMLIVGAIIAIAYAIAQGAEWASNIMYGKCWSDSIKDINNMDSKLSSLTPATTNTFAKVSIGDCVGGIIIFTRNEFSGKNDEFSKFMAQMERDYCLPKYPYSGYKSYAIVLPWKTLKEQAQKDATTWEKIKSYFPWELLPELYNKYLTRQAILSPGCIPFLKEFVNTPYFIPPEISPSREGLKALNEKSVDFCFQLQKVGTGYQITPAGLGSCPDIKTK